MQTAVRPSLASAPLGLTDASKPRLRRKPDLCSVPCAIPNCRAVFEPSRSNQQRCPACRKACQRVPAEAKSRRHSQPPHEDLHLNRALAQMRAEDGFHVSLPSGNGYALGIFGKVRTDGPEDGLIARFQISYERYREIVLAQ